VKDLNGILDAAFKIASSGRPDPVLVDIPKSIQTEMCDESEYTTQKEKLSLYIKHLFLILPHRR